MQMSHKVKHLDASMKQKSWLPKPGKWLGRTSDGNTPTLEEEYVRMTFGDHFTDKLKQSKRGWVDIPVGDLQAVTLE